MEWTENVIIADGDYVDSVAFNLTVNFERMIGRRIPPADMARWVECIALDGGMRPEGLQRSEALPTTQVVLVHGAGRKRMENFTPGNYADELHGKAFKGNLGEFVFTCINPEGFTTTDDLLADTLQLVLQADGVKRIMVVPSEPLVPSEPPVLSDSPFIGTPSLGFFITSFVLGAFSYPEFLYAYGLSTFKQLEDSILSRIMIVYADVSGLTPISEIIRAETANGNDLV